MVFGLVGLVRWVSIVVVVVVQWRGKLRANRNIGVGQKLLNWMLK